jgi:hypothetical protein
MPSKSKRDSSAPPSVVAPEEQQLERSPSHESIISSGSDSSDGTPKDWLAGLAQRALEPYVKERRAKGRFVVSFSNQRTMIHLRGTTHACTHDSLGPPRCCLCACSL